jgi:hypothetical protein
MSQVYHVYHVTHLNINDSYFEEYNT